jgi:membrane protein
LSNRQRERLALLLASKIALRYDSGQAPWSGERLARDLQVPRTNAERMLGVLCESGFLLAMAGDPPTFVPARSPDQIQLTALMDAVRRFEESESGCLGARADGEIARIERGIDQAIGQVLAGMSLRDLARAIEEQGSRASPLQSIGKAR